MVSAVSVNNNKIRYICINIVNKISVIENNRPSLVNHFQLLKGNSDDENNNNIM